MTKRYKEKYIYKITNDINDKIYIGQSVNPKNRFRSHKYDAIHSVDVGKSAIHDAMRHFGTEHFKLEIIGSYTDYNRKERELIKKFNTIVPNGYNIEKGGEEPPKHISYGENHPLSKFSNELVDNLIKDMMTQKYTQQELRKKYNVSQSFISEINLGALRRKKGIKYPIIKNSPYHLSEKQIEEIIYLLKYEMPSIKEIAEYYNVDESSIKAINIGRNHHNKDLKYPIRNFKGKSGLQPVEAILAKRSRLAIDTPTEM